MLKKISFVLVFSIPFIFNLNLNAQDKLTNALNKHLISLNTLNLEGDFNDLDSLKPFLTYKRVFGIGEATHGTHEFFLFKHRMLEFLVKEMGVKTFVIEDDFADSQIMNNYILNGEGSITDGLKGLVFGIWKTQEIVDLCNWLKAYNAMQTPENKVRFFGCDMQFVSASLKFLKEYLQPLGEFTPQMDLALTESKKPLNIIQDSDKTIMRTAADQLSQIRFAAGDTALYNHYVCEMQQYATYLEKGKTTYIVEQYEWRDKCMAKNCEWIYNYTKHQKMMIWAHNAHIGKSGGSMKVITMGEQLANYFSDQYYAIGFDFFKGKMRSFNITQNKFETQQLPESAKGSSGAVFSKCRVPDFIIDIKSVSAAEPAAAGFFNKNVLSIDLGPYYPKTGLNYDSHKLAETYDAVIFIKETTAANDMN